jgi:single-stranded-DNA-specific exonuclease
MSVMQEDSAVFDCIAFNHGQYLEQLKQGMPFEMCYSIEENVWRERRTIQLNVKGIRFSD